MTPREKALTAMWRRWGKGDTFGAFCAAAERGDGIFAAFVYRRVLAAVEHDIETGRRHFCEVCETIHPPVGPGQALLLPSEPEEMKRVLNAHFLDEVRRAGPDGIPAGVLMARLLGEAPS